MFDSIAIVITNAPPEGSSTPSPLADAVAIDRSALRFEVLSELGVLGESEARLMDAFRRCDTAELWRLDGAQSIAEWISCQTGWSQWKAGRVLRAAHALPHLPLIAQAHRAGSLCLDKTVELTRFATADTEEDLLRWAAGVSTRRVRERADEEVGRKIEEIREVHDARSVTTSRDSSFWYLDAQLPLEEGVAIEQELLARALELPKPIRGEDEHPDAYAIRCIENRNADAFVELFSARSQKKGGDETTLVLHAPLEKLADDDGAISFGGGVLHSETVRRLSCDCRLQVVLEDGNCNPVGIGRESRQIPRWLRRAVLHRDGHECTFPGCHRKSKLVVHHVQHWARKGPTDLPNLIAICPFHHFLIHEGGWSVSFLDDKKTWFKPSGRVYSPGVPLPEEPPESKAPPPTLAEAAGFSRMFELLRPTVTPPKPPEPERLRSAKQRRRIEKQVMRCWMDPP